MSLPEMVRKVKEARAVWEVILDREKRPPGLDGTHLLLAPPLWDHFSILPFMFEKATACGFDYDELINHLGFGKLLEITVDSLPPELREHYWLSLAGMVGSYDPGRDSHLRAALGEDWELRLLEELPAAVRLAFNESQPEERIAPDVRGKGKSVASRTKRLLLKTGDEAADKPRRVTAKRLEPEHMELALFAQQEVQAASDAPEEDFLAYLSNLKPHQGETHLVVGATSNVTVARVLDKVKAKVPFTKQEARVFDLLRETPDRHEVARRLGIEPESVTRTKTRIKHKIKAQVNSSFLR